MPNTKVVQSFKKSGMAKNDGGVASQGLPADFNSTYQKPRINVSTVDGDTVHGAANDLTDEAPVNHEYVQRIPDKIEPLGSVDIGPVSLGGKKS